MRRVAKYALVLVGSLSLLAGCSGLVDSADTISGTVTVPAGQNVAGTVVSACFENTSACTSEVTITVSGASARYELGGLLPGSYGVYAKKDLTGSDLYGFYGLNAERVELVSPPASGIDIEMIVVSDTRSESLAQTARKLQSNRLAFTD